MWIAFEDFKYFLRFGGEWYVYMLANQENLKYKNY